MNQPGPVFLHPGELPWRCYERKRGNIVLRLVSPADTEQAAPLRKIELDASDFRRLKYGFRLRTGSGNWYFSENGAETGMEGGGELPPYTMLVYHRRES